MKVDMSPKALTVRLMRVSQLRRLCLALGKAKRVEYPARLKPGAGATTDQQPAEPKQ
jgi:hypothetical protein